MAGLPEHVPGVLAPLAAGVLPVAEAAVRAEIQARAERKCPVCGASSAAAGDGLAHMEREHGGVTHACPVPFEDGGDGLMPCCGRTPFEVPPWHRMTLAAAMVTCGALPDPEG
jgi:hypothetical protein